MTLWYLINLITMSKVGYELVSNSANRGSDCRTNLRFEASVNLFVKNKRF